MQKASDGFRKPFEQGVGGIQIHRLDGLKQHHLAPAELRRLRNETDQITHLIDTDRLVDIFRLENVVIRMCMCCQQLTGLATTAGARRRGILAEQRRGELLGEQPLADAARAVQQIGMGMLRARHQLLPGPTLPSQYLTHRSAPAIRG